MLFLSYWHEQAQWITRSRSGQPSADNAIFKIWSIDNLVGELEALVRGEKSSCPDVSICSIGNYAYHLLLVEYWHEQSEWNRESLGS